MRVCSFLAKNASAADESGQDVQRIGSVEAAACVEFEHHEVGRGTERRVPSLGARPSRSAG